MKAKLGKSYDNYRLFLWVESKALRRSHMRQCHLYKVLTYTAIRLRMTSVISTYFDSRNDNAENPIGANACSNFPIRTPGIIPIVVASQRTIKFCSRWMPYLYIKESVVIRSRIAVTIKKAIKFYFYRMINLYFLLNLFLRLRLSFCKWT